MEFNAFLDVFELEFMWAGWALRRRMPCLLGRGQTSRRELFQGSWLRRKSVPC